MGSACGLQFGCIMPASWGPSQPARAASCACSPPPSPRLLRCRGTGRIWGRSSAGSGMEAALEILPEGPRGRAALSLSPCLLLPTAAVLLFSCHLPGTAWPPTQRLSWPSPPSSPRRSEPACTGECMCAGGSVASACPATCCMCPSTWPGMLAWRLWPCDPCSLVGGSWCCRRRLSPGLAPLRPAAAARPQQWALAGWAPPAVGWARSGGWW